MRRPAIRAETTLTKAATPFVAQPRLPVWLVAVLLVVVTLGLYWPATGFDFLNFDDPGFVTSNVHVQGGLRWEALKWAFQLNQGDYWHPLTWLSLMLDASLFGQRAGGFHFTNVAFHAANGGLLFLLLRLLTGAFWRSLMVAALFAVHPLRVESVAWVTERKDVLSGFFGLLALICYARYAQGRREKADSRKQIAETRSEQPEARGPGSPFHLPASFFYLLSLGFFACGLMSKAMLVTWPFVMLLLDYWPLARMKNAECRMQNAALRDTLNAPRSALWRLLVEKIPFFGLSGISCVLTYLTESGRQGGVGAVGSPLLLRGENALVAYARYVGKTFWPLDLAVPYGNPDHWSWLEVGGSVLVVVGVFIVVLWLGRRRPYLPVGWCWFLGTMIPVIGLTQGWGTFMADRFTYVPSIGLLILAIWGVGELTQSWRYRAPAFSVASGAAIVCCLALTRHQLGYWQDGEALFRHALEITENNVIAHNNLGDVLEKKDHVDEAIRHYQEALRLKPDFADAHNNFGNVLLKKGQTDEAIGHYQEALRLNPASALAHYNFGAALVQKGQIDEAIRYYQEALRLEPDYADAHNNLGEALDQKGQTDDAIREYREAIRLKPNHPDARNNLGAALDEKGQSDEAIRQYQAAIRLKPGHADAHNNLGLALGKKGQTDEAIRQYEEAIRLKPDYADAHYNLGVAFFQQGRTDEAIRQFQEALRLKPDLADARRNLDLVLAAKARSSAPPATTTNR